MPFAHNGAVRLWWRSDGETSKPALLLLNSIGSDLSLWDRAAPFLTPRFRLIRMDTRGHGASDAPAGDYSLPMLAEDARCVLAAAGVDAAYVCGISLGGMIAMQLALDAPHQVRGLVLACTSARLDPKAWEARRLAVLAEGPGAIAEMAMGRFFSDRFRRTHPAEVETVRSALLAQAPQGYAGCCAAVRDMDHLLRMSQIAAPTLVVAGDRDVSTPFDGHGDRIACAIPGAEVRRLDTAHLPCLEAPADFAALVVSFFTPAAVSGADAAQALFEAGLVNRREVLGDAWVDRSLAGRTPFNADYQAMITRVAWQEIWSRPGLDRRTRRLLVLAMTASLARWEEFRLHVRAGLEQDGFTRGELQETLMQIAVYAGVPAANTAFAEAADVMAEIDQA